MTLLVKAGPNAPLVKVALKRITEVYRKQNRDDQLVNDTEKLIKAALSGDEDQAATLRLRVTRAKRQKARTARLGTRKR